MTSSTGHVGDRWRELDATGDLREVKKRLRGASGKSPSRGTAGGAPVTSVAKVESDRSRKNSRTKGSRAELDVAQMFSEWSGELVRRTPQSGGWSNAKFGVTADLVCANPAFPFHVEIKHREGWVLDDLVTGVREDHDKSIVQWWTQCVNSCPKVARKDGGPQFTKNPLLVFRRNRQPWLVMLRRESTVQDVAGAFRLPVMLAADVGVLLLATFLRHEPVALGLNNYECDP